MTSFRFIPSIDDILQRPALASLVTTLGHEAVTDAARQAAAALRSEIASRVDGWPASEEEAAAWIERRAAETAAARLAPSLRPVINATGVLIHTNLGRAPLAQRALDRASHVGGGYSNLEYDIDSGERGHRHVHAERLLCDLTGAPAGLVANNNAAATLLVLAAVAAGREVIVSRGELVEIGGGFRVPDILKQSGATLREVGTTNRTRVADYLAAASDRTALILRVHPSNFRIDGFTERPELVELAALAHQLGIPLFEDLGSGWLGLEPPPAGLGREPSIVDSLRAGADLVSFSGDKLLGGPQAGIVLGRTDLVDRARRHPLMRAVRADKLTYAALEATLALWAQPSARREIPIHRMLMLPIAAIDARARALVGRLSDVANLSCRIIDGASTAGGGSAPGSALPTRLITLRAAGISAAALEGRLRTHTPPVVARVLHDDLVIDLRTVRDDEERDLEHAIRSAVQIG